MNKQDRFLIEPIRLFLLNKPYEITVIKHNYLLVYTCSIHIHIYITALTSVAIMYIQTQYT